MKLSGNGVFSFLILPVARAVLALCCCCEEAMGCGLAGDLVVVVKKKRGGWRKSVVVDSVGRSLLRLGTRAQGSICLKEIVLRLGGLLYPCDESSFADR